MSFACECTECVAQDLLAMQELFLGWGENFPAVCAVVATTGESVCGEHRVVIFCLQIAVLFFLEPFLTGTETAEAKNKVYDVGEGIIFHTISSASEGMGQR